MGTGALRAAGGVERERPVGRAVMASRRIESLRERVVTAAVRVNAEVDRVVGAEPPSPGHVGSPENVKAASEFAGLEMEIDALERAVITLENVAARTFSL